MSVMCKGFFSNATIFVSKREVELSLSLCLSQPRLYKFALIIVKHTTLLYRILRDV